MPAESYNTISPSATRRNSIAEMATIKSRPPTPPPTAGFRDTISRPPAPHTIAAFRDTVSPPAYADQFLDSRPSPMPDTATFSDRSGSPERSESPAMSDSNYWPLFDQTCNPAASQERLGNIETSEYPNVNDSDSWPLSDPSYNPPAQGQAPVLPANEEINIRRRHRFFGLPLRSRQPINIPPIGSLSSHSVTSSNHSGGACDNTPASFAEGSGDAVPNRGIRNKYDTSKTREVVITDDQIQGCKAYKVLKRRCSRKSAANNGPSLERETSNETINLNRTRQLEEVNEPDGCLPFFMRSKQWKQRRIPKHAFLSSNDVTQPKQPRADEEERATYRANRYEATLAYGSLMNQAKYPDEVNDAQTSPKAAFMAYGSDARDLRHACQVGSGQRTKRQRRGKSCPFWALPRWWDFRSMTPILERPSPDQTPSPGMQEVPNRQSIGRHIDGSDEYSSTETLPYRYPRPRFKIRADSRLPLRSVRNSYVSANDSAECGEIAEVVQGAKLCNETDETRPAPFQERDHYPRKSKSYQTLESNYSFQTEADEICYATAQPIQQVRPSETQRIELGDKRQNLITVRPDTPMRDEVEQGVDAILPKVPEVAVHELGPRDSVASSFREGSLMGSENGLRAQSTLRGSEVAIYGSRQASILRDSDLSEYGYNIESARREVESSRPLSPRWDGFDLDFGFDFSEMDLEEEVEKKRRSGALVLDMEGI